MKGVKVDYILEFEKPVLKLENQIKDLQSVAKNPKIDLSQEIKALQQKVDHLLGEIYNNLDPWERVQLSRHPMRPHAIDYINHLISDFKEMHGDRFYGDDASIIAGPGYFNEQKVMVIGIEKGRKTKDKIERSFGMPRPEGYRKALRVMKLADRFNIPVITFIDTPGAYPGLGAEKRGQSEAISTNLVEMFDLKVPVVSIIIGEGGSGGALGLAIADRVFMMKYSIYSVISPESCASILWSDPKKAEIAANSLKLVPEKAKELKVIDEIIDEPLGGAHRNLAQAADLIKMTLTAEIPRLQNMNREKLINERFEKFREMGNVTLQSLSRKSVKAPKKTSRRKAKEKEVS